MKRTEYEDLCALFESKDCKLITTKEEYDNNCMVKQDKFSYIAKCGHTHSVSITNFMRNHGIYCNKCGRDIGLENTRKAKGTKTDKTLSIREIIKKFNEIVTELDRNEELEFKLTGDKYSYADLYYRRKKDETGKWLRIQVKYCGMSRMQTTVHRRVDKNFLIVCMSSSNEFWIIPHDALEGVNILMINRKKGTKYAPFQVEKDNVASQLMEYFDAYKDSEYEELNTILKVNQKTLEAFDYTTIENIIKQNNCVLLTSCEEFKANKMNTKSLMKIEMNCGHVMECSLNLLQRRKHIKCRQCIYAHVKNKAYDHTERISEGSKQEAIFFENIKTIIQGSFVVCKSHEGCTADMILKPINVEVDEWIGIQLKTRKGNPTQLSFSKIGHYPNMVVLCLDVSDQRMFYFNGDDLLGKTSITIGKGKSRYDKYEISNNDLIARLTDSYEQLGKQNKDSMMVPSSKKQQIEHNNRVYRESILQGCKFEYPSIDGTKHDVIINGYKVQDKCGKKHPRTKNYYNVDFENYTKGDNDFYWVNLPDRSFYVFPENILLLPDGSIKHKLYIGKQYDKYKYDVNKNPNSIDDIKHIFA